MSVIPDITLCGWLGSKHQLSVWQTHVVPCYITPQTPKGKTRMEFPSVAFKAPCLLLGWNRGHRFWLKSGKCHRCEPSPSMQITVSQMWPPVYANHSGCHRCDLPSMQITVGVTDVTSHLCKSQWVLNYFLTNCLSWQTMSKMMKTHCWLQCFGIRYFSVPVVGVCWCPLWHVLLSPALMVKILFPLHTPPPQTHTHTNECYNSRVVLLYGGQTHISILWFWSGDFIIIHKPLAWQYKVKK